MKLKYIIIIIIFIITLLIISLTLFNYNASSISNDYNFKEYIISLNSIYEKYQGYNDSTNITFLLDTALKNYRAYFDEPLKVPSIKFISKEDEIISLWNIEEYENNLRTSTNKTNYYINAQKIKSKISATKTYLVTIKYDNENFFDNVSFIDEIDITAIEND